MNQLKEQPGPLGDPGSKQRSKLEPLADSVAQPESFGELVEFTPVHTHLIKEFNLTTAAVYGRVWRWTLVSGVCFAKKETIAEELGISSRSVRRSLDLLEEAGYIDVEQRRDSNSGNFRTPLIRIPKFSPEDRESHGGSPLPEDRESSRRRTESPLKKELKQERTIKRQERTTTSAEELLLSSLLNFGFSRKWGKDCLELVGLKRLQEVVTYCIWAGEAIEDPAGWIHSAIHDSYRLRGGPRQAPTAEDFQQGDFWDE